MYLYADGEKEFLYEHLLNDWLLVGFMQETQDKEIVRYINQTGLFKSADVGEIFYYPLTYCRSVEAKNRVMFVKTKKPKTYTQLKDIIRILENVPFVSFANLVFKGKKFSDAQVDNPNLVMSFSSFFHVCVNDKNDLSDLYAVTQETGTRIICQLENWKEWFFLDTDENAKGNAIQVANYFYETGKFKYAYPDFILKTVNINK